MFRALRNSWRLLTLALSFARHDALFPLETLGIAPALIAWARLFHLFGPDEPEGKFVASVAAALREGRTPHIQTPDAVRDYLDVDYAGAAIAALLASDVEGAVNIGRGEGHALGDIAMIMARIEGAPGLIDPSGGRPAEVATMVADVGRLQREVGFGPPVSLQQGLAGLIARYV